jgi:phage gp29-like protein
VGVHADAGALEAWSRCALQEELLLMLMHGLLGQGPAVPKGTVLDWSGNPVRPEATRPPKESVAETGRSRNMWVVNELSDIDPESLARLLRNSYPLPQQNALCSRMLSNDAHMQACYRDMVTAISGLDWELLPFDDSRQAKQIHKKMQEWVFAGSDKLDDLFEHLLSGEFYPFAGAEIHWGNDYLPTWDFELIDPSRWWWELATDSAKIRTLASPWMGEDLPPNGFILHKSRSRPGPRREGGLWKPAAWLYLFKHFSDSELMQFLELYGKPFRTANYTRREDKDSIYQALVDLGPNGAGVFPEGTLVTLTHGLTTGSVDGYKHTREFCNDELSELFVGHPLMKSAKSGSGTLAGGAAMKVSEKIVRGMARRLANNLGTYLLRSIVGFQMGQKAIDKTPQWKFKYEPPEDKESRAKTFVLVNTLLAPLGKAIAEEQLLDEFNIVELVDRTVNIDPAVDANGDPLGGGAPGGGQAAASRRLAAKKTTPVKTEDDAGQLGKALGKKALQGYGAKAKAKLAAAQTLEEFAASLWESYDEFSTATLASVTRDTTVLAHLIGQQDAAADAAGGTA